MLDIHLSQKCSRQVIEVQVRDGDLVFAFYLIPGDAACLDTRCQTPHLTKCFCLHLKSKYIEIRRENTANDYVLDLRSHPKPVSCDRERGSSIDKDNKKTTVRVDLTVFPSMAEA